MKKTFWFLSFSFMAGAVLNSWAQSPALIQKTGYSQALELLKKGSRSLDKDALLKALGTFQDCPGHPRDNYPCSYRAAQTCLYLVRAWDLEKRRDQAEKVLVLGIQCAQEAVSIAPGSSDAHALLARLYEQKLMFGDMFTGMDIGPKAGAENKKALELGPENPQVQLSLGIQYVMAPPIGGGDVRKGIDALKKALKLDPKMDEAWFWLAKAYRKQNDRALFEAAIHQGQKLDPKNPLFKAELEDWEP